MAVRIPHVCVIRVRIHVHHVKLVKQFSMPKKSGLDDQTDRSGMVECLGAPAIDGPHKWFSPDKRKVRTCPACKRIMSDPRAGGDASGDIAGGLPQQRFGEFGTRRVGDRNVQLIDLTSYL